MTILTSANDTSILALLSRYPSMPANEADQHIARIEYEENVPICLAVLGRISPETLNPDVQQVCHEFIRWSQDRTRRFRNEIIANRYLQREDRIANRLQTMYEEGRISEELLILYGISGDLPELHVYHALTDEEKAALWESRMERR